MSRCRTSPVLVPPLDNEDLLREILLRLPPQPSSLPRSSLVCKLWRSILSDPQFLGRFRKHHRKAPLLGFFAEPFGRNPVFTPILDSPDRIPPDRFSMEVDWDWRFMGCRHSLAVLINQHGTVVWDPLTGQHHRANFPPGLNKHSWKMFWHAAVLCSDAEDGHVHGDCFSGPFKLVLICNRYNQSLVCVYESTSGVWGHVVSTATIDTIYSRSSILAGNALYWLFSGGDILVFDIERQTLGVIEKPADAYITMDCSVQLLRTEDGRLGLAILSDMTIKLWKRKSNSDDVVGWVLQKTIPLESVFPRRLRSNYKKVHLMGYDEDTNDIILSTRIGHFMLQLDSMQIKHIIKRDNICYDTFYPYRNFYNAGKGVGWKWLDLKL